MNTKNHIFTTLILFAAVATLQAERRDLNEAEAIARQFMQRAGAPAKGGLRPLTRVSESDSLYEFADAEGRRVFVSGSTLMTPVLGYTDAPVDGQAELPCNLAAWMRSARDAVRRVEQNPRLSTVGQPATASAPVIEPLLGNIKWDQGSPWNQQCPMLKGSHTYVGCVATALAQIMYYHRYAVGRGSISYTDGSSHDIAVDFSQQTYDFSRMGPTAASTSDKDELAKFNFHVGAACQMSYDGSDGSGAYSWNAAQGLVQYFSYSDLTVNWDRSVFTYPEWCSMLINELENGRPVYYSGYSDDGGHAFVLDGIDETGAYHVNWGWGGSYNGYYDVNLLAPGGYGIGATSSAMDGFKDDQNAIFNLAPSLTEGSEGARYYCGIESDGMGIEDQTVSLGTTVEIVEYGIYDLRYEIDGNGTYGILIQQDGRDVRELPAGRTQFTAYGYGLYTWNNRQSMVNVPFTIPTDLAEGTYEVYVYFRPDDGSGRRDIFRSYAFCPSCVTMTVADGKASFVDAWPRSYEIEASDWSSDKTSYMRNIASTYSVTVTPGEDLYGRFTLIWDENGNRQTKKFGNAAYAAGSPATLTTSYLPHTRGTATCTLYFTPANVGAEEYQEGDTLFRVAVSSPYEIGGVSGSDGSALRLTKAPSLYSGTPATGQEVTFAVALQNKGDSDYNGYVALLFHSRDDATVSIVFTLSSSVTVPGDSKVTAYVTGILPDDLTVGQTYVGAACYLGPDSYEKILPSGLRISNKVTITPQKGTSGIEMLRAPFPSGDDRGEAFNLQGQRVGAGYRGLVIRNGKLHYSH